MLVDQIVLVGLLDFHAARGHLAIHGTRHLLREECLLGLLALKCLMSGGLLFLLTVGLSAGLVIREIIAYIAFKLNQVKHSIDKAVILMTYCKLIVQ